MIGRREVFKRLALAFGATAISGSVIEKAVAVTEGKPRGKRLIYMGIKSWERNKGRVYVGLPGMKVDKLEGVFFWIEPGHAVHAEFDPKDNICIGDIAIETVNVDDRVELIYQKPGGLRISYNADTKPHPLRET